MTVEGFAAIYAMIVLKAIFLLLMFVIFMFMTVATGSVSKACHHDGDTKAMLKFAALSVLFLSIAVLVGVQFWALLT